MHNVLAVVDETDTAVPALQNAVDHAERERVTLVVANVIPESVYESRQTAVSGNRGLSRDGLTYTGNQAREEARRTAERAARTAIGDRDVASVAVGAVGRPLPLVLAIAADHDCDRIYVAASKPRLFERVGLSERFDRTLAKGFDGTVVPVLAPGAGPTTPVGSVSDGAE